MNVQLGLSIGWLSSHQPFVTHLTAAAIKLAEIQINLALQKRKSMPLCS